ncbi:MAG: amidohydrolase, partial [Chitinophagaceae bacterium]
HSVDDRVVTKEFASLLKKKKTVLCPTLVVYDNYNSVLSDSYQFAPGELSNTHPTTAATVIDYPLPDTVIAKRLVARINSPAAKASVKSMDSIMMANLKILADAGVIIASGTDAGNIGTQHVSSYFIELALMQKAGLDNWQLLQASTINAARAVGQEKEWGSISKGKIANLLLLERNPLDSIGALQQIHTVISKGVMIDRDSVLTWPAADLAQVQLNAYNAHDLEGFLAPYSDDVEVYTFPDKLLAKGKDQMRKMYGFLEKAPTLYCRLLNRIVQGNIVIDHEEILGVPGAPHYGVAIYVTENGKIKKVFFPE